MGESRASSFIQGPLNRPSQMFGGLGGMTDTRNNLDVNRVANTSYMHRRPRKKTGSPLSRPMSRGNGNNFLL
jgi:hypothetical protein